MNGLLVSFYVIRNSPIFDDYIIKDLNIFRRIYPRLYGILKITYQSLLDDSPYGQVFVFVTTDVYTISALENCKS